MPTTCSQRLPVHPAPEIRAKLPLLACFCDTPSLQACLSGPEASTGSPLPLRNLSLNGWAHLLHLNPFFRAEGRCSCSTRALSCFLTPSTVPDCPFLCGHHPHLVVYLQLSPVSDSSAGSNTSAIAWVQIYLFIYLLCLFVTVGTEPSDLRIVSK